MELVSKKLSFSYIFIILRNVCLTTEINFLLSMADSISSVEETTLILFVPG